ncbi:MAG: HAD family phosphatase [Bacteroidaceae bacterium]|nr:HAD family phosphatase [Bacteroidaceae bacterium]
MIKDIVFDFGGVLTLIDTQQALQRFKEIGVPEPDKYINSYLQSGPFFSLENGDITAEEFCEELTKMCNRPISYAEAKHAWLGFIVKVQTEFLEFLQQLRPRYRLSVLSNTNPFIQSWARSKEFTPAGKSLDDYFDMLFLSYKMNCSKPGEEIYRKMLLEGNMKAEETLFIDDGERNIAAARKVGINILKVGNGEDWRETLTKVLAADR